MKVRHRCVLSFVSRIRIVSFPPLSAEMLYIVDMFCRNNVMSLLGLCELGYRF